MHHGISCDVYARWLVGNHRHTQTTTSRAPLASTAQNRSKRAMPVKEPDMAWCVASPSFLVSAAAWLRRILIAAKICDRDVLVFCRCRWVS
jgi:hypothetical protein|eukprot:COSAG06_NODE_8407_length_2185_cov_1.525887_1_plen_91_part_00